MRFKKAWMLSGLVLCTGMSWAEEGADLRELERRMTSLSQEVAALKKEKDPVDVHQPVYGLAPAASKVYHLKEGVSLGGYGEMVYMNYDKQTDAGNPSNKRDTLDFFRFVLYTGYRFSERFVLNSELEVEHASQDKRGEVAIEMATLDYLWSTPLNVRAGLLLIPMGFINELHEPTVFHGVSRPSVERSILPTTWRENGVGLFGQAGPVSYRTYMVNGFQALGDKALTGTDGEVDGYTGSSGVRDGRQDGSLAFAEDMAWVGRADYAAVPGLLVGGSLYTGKAGQSAMVSGQELKAQTTIWEAHGDYQWEGVELRGLYSRVSVGDVALINEAQAFPGTKSVGEQMWGGYGQVAFNVLGHKTGGIYLAPFFRYERYNTQAKVPDGFSADPANDRTEMVYGVTFRPISTVVLKADFQNKNNRAGSGVDQWNLGMGYMF